MLHFVGGKPWCSDEELKVSEWEEGEAAEAVGEVRRRYGPLFDLWHAVRASATSITVPTATIGATTSAEDQAAVAEMQKKIAVANGEQATARVHATSGDGSHAAAVSAVSAVSLDVGANKYVLVSAVTPSASSRNFFVRSSATAEYHKDAADPLVSELMRKGWRNVDITGGGRILLDEGAKKVVVFGFSYGALLGVEEKK